MKTKRICVLALLWTLTVPGRATAAGSGAYAPVNGLKMYYEIHGPRRPGATPLVLLHGGGSSIDTTFGRMLPWLVVRPIVAFDQQGHGRTNDRNRPFTFEESADDAVALLRHLKIERADVLGFSNGGSVALQIAIRHPRFVRKPIVASAPFERAGFQPGFFDFMRGSTPEKMPREIREAYLALSPHPDRLRSFHDKCARRMVEFRDVPRAAIRAIRAPALVMLGDSDVLRPEHGVELHRLLPKARLAVFPSDHGTYLGEATAAKKDSALPRLSAAVVSEFLDAPVAGR